MLCVSPAAARGQTENDLHVARKPTIHELCTSLPVQKEPSSIQQYLDVASNLSRQVKYESGL